MIQKPRGTMDIFPDEIYIWQHIEKTAREVAARYGFEEIRFPTFEETALFNRGVGDTTDIVQKEMYTFSDRDGLSLSLRPEGTASVARAVIENGKYADTLPLKYYYIINCFRYEKPQAGRSREFYQFGVEIFGAQNAAADAHVIAMGNALIQELRLKSTALHINSIGCPECRPKYHDALREYFRAHSDELCETCRKRLETNPLRILDCKSEICSKIADTAPRTIEYLCDDCAAHFDNLKKCLDALGITYSIDTRIVRGLDYYTRTVFEFISEGIGAQSTVCGGGRYDGLIESVGGPRMAGIGFAMGITRLILSMKQDGVLPEPPAGITLYIASLGDAASVKAIEIADRLRRVGISAESDLVGRSLKAQMKYANKAGAAYTLILGDSELESGKAQLKKMSDGSQVEIDINNIAELKAALQ